MIISTPVPGWNVALEAHDATCLASSELSGSTACEQVMDYNPGTYKCIFNCGTNALW